MTGDSATDLDKFTPASSEKRLDDKAAMSCWFIQSASNNALISEAIVGVIVRDLRFFGKRTIICVTFRAMRICALVPEKLAG